jgi:3-hydroxyisobutyrate dehydrogenase-like beta-hydroxyacid dehydrogenase
MPGGLSVDQVSELVLKAHPDMEGVGEDGGGGSVARAVADLLLPACVAAYQEGLKAALTAGAEVSRSRRAARRAFVPRGCEDEV